MNHLQRSMDILEQASMLYNRSKADYRDNLIELGKLLREYLVIATKEVTPEAPIFRRAAHIHKAAKFLKVQPEKISGWIRTSVVGELVLQGNYGKLTWWAITTFGEAVRRCRPKFKRRSRSKEVIGPEPVIETWELNPTRTEIAQLCLQAREANWECKYCREKVIALKKRKGWSGRFREKEEVIGTTGPATDRLEWLVTGSPSDVAETLAEALSERDDLELLLDKLTDLLCLVRS